ncbi:MBL fold metallo-hydrolase [Luteimicrobium xylanilyticum]|uniref:Arylsulfatase n=1 Tax=Luteimicrobium xylanilyticum TaxID=1133546 RepID=A0A5P9Q9B9_9MICO|nr:MBL fold metallo-hydrolase [Luteimicrobium xylanilyticum]QFU97750.1 Arylsulfatase [Luteimicrobium xylanilyticum]
MRLVVVGCAGSFAGPDGPASSYAVQAEDGSGHTWTTVLDLGNGSLGALQRVVDPFEVDAVALSHLHPDHVADLCGLYVYRKYHPGRGVVRDPGLGPLAVWGPPGTEARIAEAYGSHDDEDLRSVFAFRTWAPERQVRVGPFVVEVVPVRHPVEAYAIRVTGPSSERPGEQATLVYSGDTDACAGLVEAARGADLFLCEAAFQEGRDLVDGIHLTGYRAGRAAHAAGARRLVLTHLPAWNDPQVALAEATAAYAGPVELAAPGATYTL